MAKERFFNLPVLILIASSFMLGMSEFIVVGILPDIAADELNSLILYEVVKASDGI